MYLNLQVDLFMNTLPLIFGFKPVQILNQYSLMFVSRHIA